MYASSKAQGQICLKIMFSCTEKPEVNTKTILKLILWYRNLQQNKTKTKPNYKVK